MGLRRLAVTPTFAAGLGVVIAAVIAYPLTRTVISYGPEPSVGGHPCLVTDCAAAPPGNGGLATARPVLPLVEPRVRPGLQRLMPARPAESSPRPVTASPARPVMTYQTLRQYPSSFLGQVTITMPAGPVPASWRLRLSYRSADIGGIWGGSWTARGPHVVVVRPVSQGVPGNPASRAAFIRIYLTVTGPPGPPAGCELNGRPCTLG